MTAQPSNPNPNLRPSKDDRRDLVPVFYSTAALDLKIVKRRSRAGDLGSA